MHSDIRLLRTFYDSPLGQLAEQSISRALTSVWSTSPSERLVGLGYTFPWLERFSAEAERSFSFMPAGQGAMAWPPIGPSASALVFDEELPLADGSVDKLLMVHLLEHSENPRETLTEAWRVLCPSGTIIVVVPNRRGLWTRFEHTPFGTGRPFSLTQIETLLREANFTPARFADGLLFPPFRRRSLLRFATTLERMGRTFWPVFCGVHVLVGEKRLVQGLPVTERASRRIFQPVLQPAGAVGARTAHSRQSGPVRPMRPH